jgi:hypothetical protein
MRPPMRHTTGRHLARPCAGLGLAVAAIRAVVMLIISAAPISNSPVSSQRVRDAAGPRWQRRCLRIIKMPATARVEAMPDIYHPQSRTLARLMRARQVHPCRQDHRSRYAAGSPDHLMRRAATAVTWPAVTKVSHPARYTGRTTSTCREGLLWPA